MALKTVGHDANFGKALGESLAVAGVEDVRHDYRSWPIGWGHPELGKYTKQVGVLHLCDGFYHAFTYSLTPLPSPAILESHVANEKAQAADILDAQRFR